MGFDWPEPEHISITWSCSYRNRFWVQSSTELSAEADTVHPLCVSWCRTRHLAKLQGPRDRLRVAGLGVASVPAQDGPFYESSDRMILTVIAKQI